MSVETKEVAQENDKNGDEFGISNGGGRVDDQTVSTWTRCLSLLTSNDRDFLITPTGTQVKVSDLAGKVIGVYFSANWYPPCKKFTQLLIQTYDQLKKPSPSEFEVVFVSSDEDSNAFKDYFSFMPWLSIPFSDLNSKKELNKMFDVEGIPCLVILHPENGYKDEVRDGVEIVYRYGAEGYPFSRERVEELRREEREREERQTVVQLLTNLDRDFLLRNSPPKQVPVCSLNGKTVGVYFSAQWCVPGVKFTSKLISIYQKVRESLLLLLEKESESRSEEDFEIVFVSSDRNELEFSSHFHNTMPWLALPFGDPNIKDLTKYFDIRGIPCLVILGPDGKTVTKQGRNLVNLYRENAYPFTDSKVELLERQMDEEAKHLPRTEKHVGHRHELTLVSEGSGGGPFICCDCDEQGSGWVYQCLGCGYEVHPKCVRPVGQAPTTTHA